MRRFRPRSRERWCASWLPGSTSTRSGGECVSAARASTTGSATGAPAGLTRWCPIRVSAHTTHSGRGVGAGGGAAPGRPAAHGRSDPADPAHPARLGAPDERTLQRNFHRLSLTGGTAGGSAPVFGRFEAEHPHDLWTGDALYGIRIAARKTYLFAFLDDHSRL